MNDTELDAVLDLIHADLRRSPAPSSLRERVRTIPFTTPRERGRLPHLDLGRFDMFSAVKFAAAGVIVALFGGFLLAGVLTTQPDGELLPAAVTDSPEPEATREPTEVSTTSVRTDLLPGVTLTVEEVEPGVYRVVNDGLRDLAKAGNLGIVAGHDGSIWLLRPKRYLRLGDDTALVWPTILNDVDGFAVAPDGTVWVSHQEGRYRKVKWEGGLYSVGKGSDDWTLIAGDVGLVEVTSDGTVWALWGDDPEDPDSLVIGYLGADGWQSVGEWPYEFYHHNYLPMALLVSDRGEVWAIEGRVDGRADSWRNVQHLVDGAWRTYDGPDDWPGGDGTYRTAVGADGTLWGTYMATRNRYPPALFRLEGTEWTTFEWPDWMPGGPSAWGEVVVAPDGALWIPTPFVECDEQRDRCVCDHRMDSIASFDGVAWSRLLQGRCVQSMSVADDGSVWLLATESGGDLRHVYVITPEAVAAAG